jgi:ribosomal protein S27AE
MSQYGDEPCETYEMRERVARKAHKCSACGETIQPGAKYAYVFLVHEGDPHIYKRCPRCQAIFVHLSERIRGEGDHEEFCDEMLGCGHEYEERWEEPPPEWLAALAFWLPGDPLPVVPKEPTAARNDVP